MKFWKHKRKGDLKCRCGFTLIELLTVIAIIMLLAGLLLASANAAKEKARKAKAAGEVRELAKAWKQYWIIYNKWPEGFSSTVMEMDSSAMQILLGEDASENPQQLALLNPDITVRDRGFQDPWGVIYRVEFDFTHNVDVDYYEGAVFFPNRNRYITQ